MLRDGSKWGIILTPQTLLLEQHSIYDTLRAKIKISELPIMVENTFAMLTLLAWIVLALRIVMGYYCLLMAIMYYYKAKQEEFRIEEENFRVQEDVIRILREAYLSAQQEIRRIHYMNLVQILNRRHVNGLHVMAQGG